MIFVLVFRNLFRRKKRTLVTAMSVALGVWIAALAIGTREYTYQRLMEVSSQLAYGNLTLASQDFFLGDYKNPIKGYEALVKELKESHPEIKDIIPRLMGEAYIASSENDASVGFMAMDPERETEQTSIIMGHMVEGRFIHESLDHQVNIGHILAQKLMVTLGDEIIYTTTDFKGEVTSYSAEVVGIFATGNQNTDRHVIIFPLKQAKEDLHYPNDHTQFLSLFVAHHELTNDLFNSLHKNPRWPSPIKLFHWSETQGSLASFVSGHRIMTYLMIFFLLLVISSGIFTCTIINVVERRKEIGTMLALGMGPTQIFSMIILESLVISFLGCGMGWILVSPFHHYLAHYGWDMTPYFGENYAAGGVELGRYVMKSTITWAATGMIIASLFVLTILAATGPAIRAVQISPIKAISEE